MFRDATAVREWTGLLQRHEKRLENIAHRIASVMGVADETDEIIQESHEALLGKWAKVRSTARPTTGACRHHGSTCDGRAEFWVRGKFIEAGAWTMRRRPLCTPCRVETDDDRQCAYFTGIATNKAADHAKKKSLRPTPTLDDPDAPPLASGADATDVQKAVEDHEAATELGIALRKLPPEAQQILVLRYALGYSVAETARKLGLEKSAVTTRTSRAVAKLHKELPEWIRVRYREPHQPPEPEEGAEP